MSRQLVEHRSNLVDQPGMVARGSSSEISAEPRQAGLSSSSPRRSSSVFWRKRNWPIAVRDGALAIVVRAGGRLQLVGPLRPQAGELALGALLGERGTLRSG